jgi:hypothetical protein
MTRMEMLLWVLVMLALASATTAKADHLYAGPPVGQAYAMSIELSREAAALSYDVERLLCDCNDYNDVLEELCDLAEELDDLNASLRQATFKPRKWNRVCKRAEDVVEEVCELDEEIHEAVDDLNRYRPRQTAFVPRGPSFYNSPYRTAPDVAVSLRFGTGRTRIVKHINPVTPRGIPVSAPYRGAAEGYVKPRLGYELEERVHRMRALAEEIHRLSHAG